MEKKSKIICLLLSGGLDSVYLLDVALKRGHHVRCVYTVIENNPTKLVLERKAICGILKYYQNLYGNNQLELVENNVNINSSRSYHISDFPQIPFHILSLVFSARGCDECWIGYCMSDQAVSYLDEIKKIWRSYNALMSVGKYPKLVFPASKVQKSDELAFLNNDVKKMLYSCESPIEGSPCHQFCPPCVSYKNMYISAPYDTKLDLQKTNLVSPSLYNEIMKASIKDCEEDVKTDYTKLTHVTPVGTKITTGGITVIMPR